MIQSQHRTCAVQKYAKKKLCWTTMAEHFCTEVIVDYTSYPDNHILSIYKYEISIYFNPHWLLVTEMAPSLSPQKWSTDCSMVVSMVHRPFAWMRFSSDPLLSLTELQLPYKIKEQKRGQISRLWEINALLGLYIPTIISLESEGLYTSSLDLIETN
jgi:hypothetical protein